MRHECSFDLKINITGKGGVKLMLEYSVDKNLNLQPFWANFEDLFTYSLAQ